MENDILAVFLRHFKDLKFDKSLIKQLQTFRLRWVNKNQDHVEFLGGNLLGVNPIRFSIIDEEALVVDILEIDMDALKAELHALPDVNPKFKIASNPVYLTLIYMIYRFYNSDLPDNIKDVAIKEIYYIFAFKAMGSLLSHYFKFNLDKGIALVVYEKLSNKFLIKQLDNWQEVFTYRAKDVLEKGGLHKDRIKNFNAIGAGRVVADLQGRLRETVKYIYKITDEVVASGEHVKLTTLEDITEGEDNAIKDIVDRPDSYSKFISSIITKEHDFIKPELVEVVGDLVSNVSTSDLKDVLQYISRSDLSRLKDINVLIEDILITCISYLKTRDIEEAYEKDVNVVMVLIKNYWSNSKVKDPTYLSVKKRLVKLSYEATKKNTKWKLVTLSMGIILYVILRSFAKNLYK